MLEKDCVYIGHFGGKATPKSINVDICVSPEDRKNDFAVATVTVPTYAGKVTRKGLFRIAEVMVATKATTAQVWNFDYNVRSYGWTTLMSINA